MLLDSNIIIYSARPQYRQVRDFIATNRVAVSAISYVEVLGYTGLTDEDALTFEGIFASIRIFDVVEPVIRRASELRRQRRMSLGDAIIAATALLHDLTLITRNIGDFNWVAGLRVRDPMA
jgi:predicted nucleic acid-binding protein